MSGDAGQAVEVVQQGFTWGSILIGAGVWSCLAAIVGYYFKTRAPLKKLQIDGDTSLREELTALLTKQDVEHSARVSKLEQKLEDQRAMYEARIEFERVSHESEIRTMRHRMNNLDQCLTMLLALIESNPAKAQDAAAKVNAMRAKQEAAEAQEKATIEAARIAAAAAARNASSGSNPPTP